MHLSIQTSIFSEDILGNVTQQNFTHQNVWKKKTKQTISPQTFQSQIVSTRCGIMRNQGESAFFGPQEFRSSFDLNVTDSDPSV